MYYLRVIDPYWSLNVSQRLLSVVLYLTLSATTKITQNQWYVYTMTNLSRISSIGGCNVTNQTMRHAEANTKNIPETNTKTRCALLGKNKERCIGGAPYPSPWCRLKNNIDEGGKDKRLPALHHSSHNPLGPNTQEITWRLYRIFSVTEHYGPINYRAHQIHLARRPRVLSANGPWSHVCGTNEHQKGVIKRAPNRRLTKITPRE